MKKNKFFISTILVIIFVLFIFPVGALAATDGDYTYDDNGDGTCTVTGYSGASADLTIPDTLGGLTVTIIGDNAFFRDGLPGPSLTSVSIPNTVTEIGANAFGYNNISSVTLPSTDPSIGKAAFNANAITTVNGAPSNGLFYGNYSDGVISSNLVSYGGADTVIDFIPEIVTNIEEQAFYGCQLTSVTIPSGVIFIGDFAFGNNSITDLTLPNGVQFINKGAFNDNKITTINGAPANGLFYKRTDGIEDTSKIISYGGASKIIDFIPSSVITIGEWAFESSSATSVTIPGNVTEICNWAFMGCGIDNLILSNGVMTIGNQAFGYNSLSNIVLPNSINRVGHRAFADNIITTFVLPGLGNTWESLNSDDKYDGGDTVSVNGYYGRTYEILDNGDSTSKILNYNGDGGNLDIPGEFDGLTVTAIGTDAFRGNNLGQFSLPETLTSIGHSAFADNGFDTFELPEGAYYWTGVEDLKTDYRGGDSVDVGQGYERGEAIPAPTPTPTPTPTPAPTQTPTPTPTQTPTPDSEVQKGEVSGVLLDADGNPLADYSVTMYSDPVTVVTNSAGEFTFTNIELTKHTLVIETPGGSEIARYALNFVEADDSSTSISGDDINIGFTESAAAIDMIFNVSEDMTIATLVEIEIVENPETGDDSSNVLWYILAFILAFLLVSCGWLIKKRIMYKH